MEWSKLLSNKKLREEDPEPSEFDDYPINSFEKDYNSIVSSSVFRRLQDKTQVFPLDKSDFIRTRLTHSIEVSTIARQLGIMLSTNTTNYEPRDINSTEAEGIASVLLCAGLLHDLGNPPFGHFGETIIGGWFKDKLSNIEYKGRPLGNILSEQMFRDLECFEGNAQALRILAKARYQSGINVSAAVISTLVKYPTNSLSFDKDAIDIGKHKLGYFLAEYDTLLSVSEMVGTISSESEICRHPLAYILEAADDIAYATADLEDAFKKKLFSLTDFIDFYESLYDNASLALRYDTELSQRYYQEYFYRSLIDDLKARRSQHRNMENESRTFTEWITYTRRWLMHAAVFGFSRNYTNIMQGSYTRDLFSGTNYEKTIKILKKDVMRKFVFNSPSVLKLELSSQTILSFLLGKFVCAILYCDYADEDFKPSEADKKYLDIFSINYKQDYAASKTGDEATDLYLRLLMVIDYISGMTDSYARTLYRELSGIE